MIIIRFHGGLGNQIFEYIFFEYMCRTYADSANPPVIKADLTWFDRNRLEHQGYELERVFGIKLPIASYSEVARIHEYYPKHYPLAGMRYIARKIAKKKNQGRDTSDMHIFDFGPSQYVFNELFSKLDVSKDWYIEGVYSSDAYLKCYEKEIKSKLTFIRPLTEANKLIADAMSKEESVAIHVRRGDYVGNVFDIVTTDYYKEAVEYISNKLSNPVFYVFSDDMEYIVENFDFLPNFIPVHNSGKDSYVDMQLISRCKHMIIANSSFSYFGAVLGEKEDSIVIAPKRYKADEELALARSGWILM